MENIINTKVKDAFWNAKQKDFLKGMLEHQWSAMNDEYENSVNHTIRNIKMAAGVIPREEIPRDDFGKEKFLDVMCRYFDLFIECFGEGEGLYNVIRPEKRPAKITLVPYGTWNNRGKGEMRVWLMAK